MDWLLDLFSFNNRFLGIQWNPWKVVGMTGNAVFFSRFLVQWFATERQGRVVVPAAFWWLSLFGSGLLLLYAVFYRQDSVFILAYAFTWIPYIRNLVIHQRTASPNRACSDCGPAVVATTHFCPQCGARLAGPS